MGEPPNWKWFVPVQGKYLDAVIKKLSHEFLSYSELSEEDECLEDKKNK